MARASVAAPRPNQDRPARLPPQALEKQDRSNLDRKEMHELPNHDHLATPMMSMFCLLPFFLRLVAMMSIYLSAITITTWLTTPDAAPAEDMAANVAARLSIMITSAFGTTLLSVALPSEPGKRETASLRDWLTVQAAHARHPRRADRPVPLSSSLVFLTVGDIEAGTADLGSRLLCTMPRHPMSEEPR